MEKSHLLIILVFLVILLSFFVGFGSGLSSQAKDTALSYETYINMSCICQEKNPYTNIILGFNNSLELE